MIVRDFRWGYHRDSGNGWIPTFLGDKADPVYRPAHDIFDHVKGDEPTLEQEIMALGAAIYRSPFGMRPGIAVGGTLRDEHWEGNRVQTPPRHVNLRRLPQHVRQVIERASIEAEDSLWSDARPGTYEGDLRRPEDILLDYEMATIDHTEDQRIRSWLALGWLRASRRFYDINIQSVFEEVNRAFEHYAGDDGEFEGQILRMRINWRTEDIVVLREREGPRGSMRFEVQH